MVSAERLAVLTPLQERLNYWFSNPELLDRALTHRSFLHESAAARRGEGPVTSYEALEFLGDSILGFVVSELLFLTYPHLPEGELSKIKSFLVSTKQLSLRSKEMGLGEFLRVSYGEEKTGGRFKKAILADLFESLTAAIYLDGGLGAARDFILRQFSLPLSEIAAGRLSVKDFKSSLQERAHLLGLPEPRYRILEEIGPDHRKEFLVEVGLKGHLAAQARGRSRKEAEQKAAQTAMEKLSPPLESEKVQPGSSHDEPDEEQGEDVVEGVREHR